MLTALLTAAITTAPIPAPCVYFMADLQQEGYTVTVGNSVGMTRGVPLWGEYLLPTGFGVVTVYNAHHPDEGRWFRCDAATTAEQLERVMTAEPAVVKGSLNRWQADLYERERLEDVAPAKVTAAAYPIAQWQAMRADALAHRCDGVRALMTLAGWQHRPEWERGGGEWYTRPVGYRLPNWPVDAAPSDQARLRCAASTAPELAIAMVGDPAPAVTYSPAKALLKWVLGDTRRRLAIGGQP